MTYKSLVRHSKVCILTWHRICGPLVTVVVGGEERHEISVHRTILNKSSKFFANAVKSEWKDLRVDPGIELVHVDLYTFQIYTHWLYCGTLPIDGKGKEAFPTLAQAYVLGEELMDVKFKNDVLDTIIATATEASYYPIGRAVEIIYGGTPPSSPARRLMVDFLVAYASGDHSWTDEFENCPREFLLDAMKILVMRRQPDKQRPWKDDRRSYHESEEHPKV